MPNLGIFKKISFIKLQKNVYTYLLNESNFIFIIRKYNFFWAREKLLQP